MNSYDYDKMIQMQAEQQNRQQINNGYDTELGDGLLEMGAEMVSSIGDLDSTGEAVASVASELAESAGEAGDGIIDIFEGLLDLLGGIFDVDGDGLPIVAVIGIFIGIIVLLLGIVVGIIKLTRFIKKK